MRKKTMNMEPTYIKVEKIGDGQIFLRNYRCPHYDQCLNDAAKTNSYLDCCQCAYRNVVDPDFRKEEQFVG